jgi:sodium/potassium/calcium exchanger 6
MSILRLLLAGAGIFVTTVIAGTISVISPFKAMERPLLRDIIFFIGAVFLVFCVLYTGQMTLAFSIGKRWLVAYVILILLV